MMTTAEVPSKPVLGSGTVVTALTSVSWEKLSSVVVPSRLTLTVNANPSVISLVSTGIVPAASENMLNAKVLPEVDMPLGELRAGP